MKAMLMKINRIYWIVGVIILLAIAGLVVWNMTGRSARSSSQLQTYKVVRSDLTQSIGGTGSVRAKQSALLVWQTTGKIGAVNVGIGDKVTADQVLASLDQSSLPQAIIQAGVDLVTAQTTLAQLTVSNTGFANAQQAVATAQQTLKTAQDKLDAANYPRASDTLIENTAGQITLGEQSLARASDRYRMLSHMANDNPAKAQALVNMTNAQMNLNTLIANYNWYSGTPTSLDLAQAQSARDVAQAQLADAQRTLDTYKNGSVPADLAAAQAKVAIAQSTLNQAKITAPFAGVITEASPNTGDLVSNGTQAFRVDSTGHLLVDVQVSEVDINNIKAGMPVTMQFDAISGKTYHGQIVKINLAGDTTSNAVTFTVTAELTDADALVKPGMSATVTIIVRQTKGVLAVPNRAIFSLNGKHFVRLVTNGIPAQVEVQVGIVTDTVTEIVSGIQEGDTIALPSATTTSGFGGGGFGGGAVIRGGG